MSVCYCYVRDSRMYRLVPPTWKGDDSSRRGRREEGERKRGNKEKRKRKGKLASALNSFCGTGSFPFRFVLTLARTVND